MSVAFRGGRTCHCVAESLPVLEELMLLKGLISDSVDIFQLGYRTDVSASAGTHSGGGCTDVGQFSNAHLKFWRTYGWTIQRRVPPAFIYHGHGWPNGCPHLAPAAQYQQRAWNNGRDGLVSNGRITGPGPKGKSTPSWEHGLELARKEIMAIEDRIAAKVLAGMKKPASASQIAAAVWNVGIPSPRKDRQKWPAWHLVDWLSRVSGGNSSNVDALVKQQTALVNQQAAMALQIADLTALIQKGQQS